MSAADVAPDIDTDLGAAAGEGALLADLADTFARHGEHPPPDVLASWLGDLLHGG